MWGKRPQIKIFLAYAEELCWSLRYYEIQDIFILASSYFVVFFWPCPLLLSSLFNNYFQFTHWEWDLFPARNLTNTLYLLKDELGPNGILICREEIYIPLYSTVILIRSLSVPNVIKQLKMTFKTTIRQKQNKKWNLLALFAIKWCHCVSYPFTSVFSYLASFSSENSLHCWK